MSFNPSSNTLVDQIKRKAAELIDLCEDLKDRDCDPTRLSPSERNRCLALAQTGFEEAAMWAVKGATFE